MYVLLQTTYTNVVMDVHVHVHVGLQISPHPEFIPSCFLAFLPLVFALFFSYLYVNNHEFLVF